MAAAAVGSADAVAHSQLSGSVLHRNVPLRLRCQPLLRRTVCRVASTQEVAPSAAIRAGAPDVQPATEAILLDVNGMKCGGCAAGVKRRLMERPEVHSAAVNLVTGSAVVSVHSPAAASLSADLSELLTSQGFPAQPRTLADGGLLASANAAEEAKQQELKKGLLDLGIAWGLVAVCCAHHVGHFAHAMGWHEYAHTPLMHALGTPAVSATLGAIALLGPGRKLLTSGVASLWRGHPDMNSLIGLGAATSFLAGGASLVVPGVGLQSGFLEEPVMLLAIVLLGRNLEARARLRASADLRSLAALIPEQSRMVLDSKSKDAASAATFEALSAADTAQVPTASVAPGDVLRILPGERMPVDGLVLAGRSVADEAMLTGEAALVPKGPGDQVTAGTVNYEGAVTVRATSTGADSTLAGIAGLVAEAQGREAPVQRLADSVAGRFCYTVMAAAAATFAFWTLGGAAVFPDVIEEAEGGALALAVRLAVDVLVVACPCALGLATPTAVLVASAAGARRGLLLRGGDVLEAAAAVDTVVLDKTGTLTHGRMQLTSSHTFGGASDAEVLQLAAAVESCTRHPVADAVLSAAQHQGLPLLQLDGAHTEAGEGVRGFVDGLAVAVGRREWVQGVVSSAQHIAPSAAERMSESSAASSETVVYVGVEGRGIIGSLGFRDSLRPDAVSVVKQLQHRGMRVLLVSGDSPAAAAAVAREVGIPETLAWGGQRPEGKVEIVERLRAEGRHVAVVGDGVNDAPALAAAHVGVALQGGMDAAAHAASVVLMGNRLGQFIEALDLGSATVGKIRQNLGWALAYNLVGIPLAAGALLPAFDLSLSPAAAGGMMAFSSIAVVSNSLLLRRLGGDQPSGITIGGTGSTGSTGSSGSSGATITPSSTGSSV